MYQQQLLHTRFFFFVVSIFCLLQQQSAFHLFLVNNNNNSLYFSLPLYPFFVSKSEDKKGSRDCACCSEEFANSLPANISSFRPSVAEKWEPRLNSFCPLSNTSPQDSIAFLLVHRTWLVRRLVVSTARVTEEMRRDGWRPLLRNGEATQNGAIP